MDRARDAFSRGVTRPIEYREKQIKGILNMFVREEEKLLAALRTDLRRHKMESMLLELDYTKNELKHMLENLRDWVKPEKVH